MRERRREKEEREKEREKEEGGLGRADLVTEQPVAILHSQCWVDRTIGNTARHQHLHWQEKKTNQQPYPAVKEVHWLTVKVTGTSVW